MSPGHCCCGAEHVPIVSETDTAPGLDCGATTSQAEIAHALQMFETTVKVSIHRMRTRFRELIRAEIAVTVNDPADVADELRHLIAVAASG